MFYRFHFYQVPLIPRFQADLCQLQLLWLGQCQAPQSLGVKANKITFFSVIRGGKSSFTERVEQRGNVCEGPATPQLWVARKRLPCWRYVPGEAGCRPRSPLPELLEDDPVGEALAADPNALKNPVAAQLVQHQMGIQFASLKKTHG